LVASEDGQEAGSEQSSTVSEHFSPPTIFFFILSTSKTGTCGDFPAVDSAGIASPSSSRKQRFM
jgi:hypothetical protein